MSNIYHLKNRSLTIWHADGNGKRVCISKYRPLPTVTNEAWKTEVNRILIENDLARAAKWEGKKS